MAACIHLSSIAGFRHQSNKLVPRKTENYRSLTTRCALEEFPFGDGPVEPTRPKFSRDPHTDLSFIPVSDPAAAPLKSPGIKISQRRRRNRPWKKATPAQPFEFVTGVNEWISITHFFLRARLKILTVVMNYVLEKTRICRRYQAIFGSIVGAIWAVLAQKATTIGYEHLQGHPVAHDLPMGLTSSVNSLLVSAVIGFGGFAACMFGVSSFGLALLAIKLLTTPKPPVQ